MKKEIDISNAINKEIQYEDYMGQLRAGTIAFLEPYNGSSVENDGSIYWVYIADDEMDMNIHQFVVNEQHSFMYAEVRLSTEVWLND